MHPCQPTDYTLVDGSPTSINTIILTSMIEGLIYHTEASYYIQTSDYHFYPICTIKKALYFSFDIFLFHQRKKLKHERRDNKESLVFCLFVISSLENSFISYFKFFNLIFCLEFSSYLPIKSSCFVAMRFTLLILESFKLFRKFWSVLIKLSFKMKRLLIRWSRKYF